MKALKLGVFALALGFFAASCGNSDSAETPNNDSVANMEAPAETPAPTEPAATTPAVDSPAATTPAAPAVDSPAKK